MKKNALFVSVVATAVPDFVIQLIWSIRNQNADRSVPRSLSVAIVASIGALSVKKDVNLVLNWFLRRFFYVVTKFKCHVNKIHQCLLAHTCAVKC